MAGKTLSRLFFAYQAELLAYLTRKVRNADIAADLTQETFLRLAETGPASTEAVRNHRAYLYRVAHNLAIDHLRGQRPTAGWQQAADGAEALVPDDRPSPEHVVADRRHLDRIATLLQDLPLRTRQVFVCVRLDGMTYRQAAQTLGLSDSSVQKHLAKALKHIMTGMHGDDPAP